MMILVCGLSKSGKTSLISKAEVGNFGIVHVRASDILETAGQPTSEVRARDVHPNQTILVQELLKLGQSHKEPLLLDGHLLIETVEGPQLVPDASLDPLPIGAVILIEIEAETVAARRQGSTLSQSRQEITDLAQIEAVQAKRFARRRKVPHTVVYGEDVDSFTAALQPFR